MERTIEYLDQDASPITSELYTEGDVIISGEIIGTYITLVDPDGNEHKFEVASSEGGPLVRPRRPR